jgi:AcrR family transcriptional regulator
MARRNDHTREELREMALSAARRIVKSVGIQGLTTRAVARDMGYTVGTLYLIFQNLDDLVCELNAQTIADMRVRMEQATSNIQDPAERLKTISHNYLAYALEHPNLWRLAFEHQASGEEPTPDSVTFEADQVLNHVLDALRQLLPTLSADTLPTVAAAFWSGIHGICHLTLTDTLKVAKAGSEFAVLDYQVDVFLAGLERATTT